MLMCRLFCKEKLSSRFFFSVCQRISSNTHKIPRKNVHTATSFKDRKPVSVRGLFLLLVPIATFGLGTWQVKRRRWKLKIIEDLKSRTNSEQQELPYDLSELEHLEYYPVSVKGRFDHTNELYLGPRSLIRDGDAASEGSLYSGGSSSGSGFCVVTPFHLSDRKLTILINRGWVPKKYKNPATRKAGQIEDEVEITGYVRLNEQRAPFTPQNVPNAWFYRDVDQMAKVTNAAPVFLDATSVTSVPGGPIGGQTRVNLRNEHLSYILTWYSLSAATGFMWIRMFLHL